MYVRKKISGMFLLECLVAIGISAIILPIIASSIRDIYHGIIKNISMINLRLESIERYYKLYEDTQIIRSMTTNCCFQTDEHDICYDIKNSRFRRRKKSFDSVRYYTHYIGGYDHLTTMSCAVSNSLITILIESDVGSQEYLFYLSEWSDV